MVCPLRIVLVFLSATIFACSLFRFARFGSEEEEHLEEQQQHEDEGGGDENEDEGRAAQVGGLVDDLQLRRCARAKGELQSFCFVLPVALL